MAKALSVDLRRRVVCIISLRYCARVIFKVHRVFFRAAKITSPNEIIFCGNIADIWRKIGDDAII